MTWRKWTHAPLWVDLVVQAASWGERWADRLSSALFGWRWNLLDRHCQCDKCRERRRGQA